ncbi:hypothetical protein KY289_026183 [Solanum tuberosum]|nr:hypothetical protein KY289_026183 [Solanum tuberosum]
MKQQADSHRRDVTFQVGDSVFLRVQPYRQPYELELPASSKVHPIFHVSLLCPANGQQAVDRPLEEASWENYDLIADQFPSFRLEDKATFQGGCTDTNAPLRTYSRRKYRQAAWGDAILPNCPVCLFKFLHDQDWRIHHAAVTAIGLISDGCSKALLVEMVKLGQSIVNLMQDSHPRLLPALIEVLDDFDYPRLQTRAASVIRLFSRNCRADDLKLYLRKIVSKLVRFLQRGLAMMKEAALETLASVAISSQEDSAYIYDSIIPYLGNCY